MSAFGGHSTLNTSLRFAWTLDETSGNRVDMVESKSLTDTNTVTSSTGKRSNSAYFTQANSECLVGSTTSKTNSDASVSLWAKANNVDTRWCFGWCRNAAWGNEAILGVLTVGGDWYAISGNAPGNYNDMFGPTCTTATWYHLIYTYKSSGSECNFYVNNSTAYTDTWVGTPGAYNDNTRLVIGANPGTGLTQYWDGDIDEVYVWDKVLSSQERTDLYNSGNGLYYRSAETSTKTGQTDASSGVSHAFAQGFTKYGQTDAQSGVSSPIVSGTVLSGSIAATSGVDSQISSWDNWQTRFTRETSRNPRFETKYNRRAIYPRGEPKGWRGDRR